jgi:predicted nucleotidyltransferase
MLTQDIIVDNVRKQLTGWTSAKYGWKRVPHKALMEIYKFFPYVLFGRRKWSNGKSEIDLGTDEFGRSVFAGLQLYVDILKNRGIKLNTVLVQGSRAKGRWKPTSDVDVTIISEDFPRKKESKSKQFPAFINKFLQIKRNLSFLDIPLSMGIEPSFVCTKQDFMDMLENFDIHALDAIYYGEIIYDDGFWQEASDRFRMIEMKYNLDKTDLKRMISVV